MSIWNLIGKYLLLRWLFGHRDSDRHDRSCPTIDRHDYSPWHDGYDDHITHDPYDTSLYDFHEEQDDYDMIDDDC